ncbi:MAG: DNA translocase FtsK [Anaerolineales bacterium]
MTSSPDEVSPSPVVRLILRLQRFTWDASGIFLLTLGLLTMLGLLPSASGTALLAWGDLLYHWMGWGAWTLPPFLLWNGGWLLRRSLAEREYPWRQVVGWESAAISLLAFLSLWNNATLVRVESGLDGGIIGWVLAQILLVFPRPLALVITAGLIFSGTFTGMGWGQRLIRGLRARLDAAASSQDGAGTAPALSVSPSQDAAPPEGASVPRRKRKFASLPLEFRKNFRIEKEAPRSEPPPERPMTLPPLSLLDNQRFQRPDERHINQTAGLIEKTLAEFGVPAQVVGFQVGPTITQFALQPGFVEKGSGESEEDSERQKVRVAQIVGLRRDLALALSAERLRIQAPVPGRPYVGIEVPNSEMQVVRLRPLLEHEAFYGLGAPLGIALGRDVSGAPLVADLGKMPHLLVAGTTGSGKSVCISAITTCMAMNNSPQDLRMVMIDPKMVELLRFNGLPHIFGKVETDLERILGVLRWVVAEMDRRYKLLEASRSRHIDSHNQKVRKRNKGEYLPRLVVLIDELADLMMAAPDETEHALVRLAQLARAVGIHLVVATQRPSTDVVTGLIKANFPARLSFAVASGIDSRVILDTPGAEALLGRGDMLFLPPDAPAPIRSQGVMVTDREIQRLIEFWQKQMTSDGTSQNLAPWEEMLQAEAYQADRDDLVEQAIAIVRETQQASASMLQRRLRIGYPRAARLIEELEVLGVVGPSRGGGRPREVLDEDGAGEE